MDSRIEWVACLDLGMVWAVPPLSNQGDNQLEKHLLIQCVLPTSHSQQLPRPDLLLCLFNFGYTTLADAHDVTKPARGMRTPSCKATTQ